MRESGLKIYFCLAMSFMWSVLVEIIDQIRNLFSPKDKSLNLLRMRPWLYIPIKEKDTPKIRKRR